MKGLLSVWCLTAAVALQGAPIASAQDYPSKPIRAIGGSAAGGISDVFIRTLGEELHKRWGQPIVVENRPGGTFNIGARACAEEWGIPRFCSLRIARLGMCNTGCWCISGL